MKDKKENIASFYISRDFEPIWKEFIEWAEENEVSRSAFIQQAIKSAFQKNKEKKRQKLSLNFDEGLVPLEPLMQEVASVGTEQ